MAASTRRRQPALFPRFGFGAVMVLLAMALLAMMGGAGAQQAPQPLLAPPATDVEARRSELDTLQRDLSRSEEQRRKYQADIEEYRTDRVRLNAALIDTTARIHDAEGKVAAVEMRLDTLTGSETAISRSLAARRGTIAEVLAALQRMGRKPLPAILVRPEDMLLAIRTSMLLGSVVPELRGEVEALAADLAELGRLHAAITGERDTLSRDLSALNAEQRKLPELIAARQAAQNAAEGALDSERSRAADLARRATSLKDLIARLEAEAGPARRAADAARAADETRRRDAEADAEGVRARLAAGPFKDPARLAPATTFVDAKGLLPLPAAGTVLKRFGTDDGFGSAEHGLSIATRPRAPVSSPADGWVSFSGPYRTYGQLLIINAGSGYYIVLAGMDHVNVALGQFVLAGEPVGDMGDGSVRTAAAIALGAAQPVLYVEFRKDGAAVDPSPWWAKAETEKVRG